MYCKIQLSDGLSRLSITVAVGGSGLSRIVGNGPSLVTMQNVVRQHTTDWSKMKHGALATG